MTTLPSNHESEQLLEMEYRLALQVLCLSAIPSLLLRDVARPGQHQHRTDLPQKRICCGRAPLMRPHGDLILARKLFGDQTKILHCQEPLSVHRILHLYKLKSPGIKHSNRSLESPFNRPLNPTTPEGNRKALKIQRRPPSSASHPSKQISPPPATKNTT